MPNYLDYEIAVLKSNIAACQLKLSDWKAAVETATAALDSLDRVAPPKPKLSKDKEGNDDQGVVEIEGEEGEVEQQLEKLKMSDERKEEVQRIRTKTLMRRAKGKAELGGWGNLQGAEDGTSPHRNIGQHQLFFMPSDPLTS